MLNSIVSTFQMKKEKLFQMRISIELLEKANAHAAKMDISLAQLIRQLLRAEIEKDKPSA